MDFVIIRIDKIIGMANYEVLIDTIIYFVKITI